jgi:hypothetical protein
MRNELKHLPNRSSCEVGNRLVEDRDFQTSVQTYLQSFCNDTNQLAYGRPEVITAARKVVPNVHADQLWCGFAQASDRYFDDQGKIHSWAALKKTELLQGWLKLTLPAFVPTRETQRVEFNDMRAWIAQYARATDEI